MEYKNDVIFGTWAAVYTILGLGVGTWYLFNTYPDRSAQIPEPPCYVCRWTNPDA